MSTEILAIDVASALAGDPGARQSVAKKLSEACEKIGFLVIEGHNLPQALIDRTFTETRAFFDLPRVEKDRFQPTIPGIQRGYQAFESRNLASTVGATAPPDLRETMFLGPIDDYRHHFAHIPSAAGLYAPNILPDQPVGIDQTLIELYRHFERTAAQLMELLALSLALPESHFADKIDRHFNILGCHHYPALSRAPLPGQLRAGAHTDFGAVTLLAVNDAPGGLEIQMRDQTWHQIHPRPGQLVINLGDMMARWTNDRWRSTLHRVMTPPNDGNYVNVCRQSIAYFLHPNYDTEISCFLSCLLPGETALYPTITAGEHIALKIARSHEHLETR